jgi:integrase|uniref:Integrase n=1 Tax=Siphoviridae sp. ctrgQ8 TaxID=2825689 RepID=A0A8S5PMX5_9CAUD|nr:MAG TPA: Integrase [Siphoviridae sp. ctrgQ8]
MNIKRNCIFLLDKEKEKPDSKLRYRIKWDGNTVAFNVGYRVDNNKWVAEAQRCKPNTTHGKKKISAATINSEINRLEEIVNDTFFFFEQTGQIPTSLEFRDEVNKRNGKIVEKEKKTIFDCYQQFIIEQGKENSWSENTYRKHKSAMNHLKKFAPELTFADLTHEGLSHLVDYFMSIEVDNEIGMNNYTAKKYINLTKWFLKWASEKGYNNELAFVTFKEKLKTVPVKVIFLEWDELMKVYNATFPDAPHLETAKDVFCFQCFTSLRYSDVYNLKKTDVYNGYITITTIKTGEPLKIELNKYSKAILEKYKDIESISALPVPSNRKLNKYVKDVCKACEINEPVCRTYYKGVERIDEIHPKYELIGTHCGRKTFICNALMMGIAPNIVMKWTGHRDYQAMRPYIDIADKAKEEAMKLFNR